MFANASMASSKSSKKSRAGKEPSSRPRSIPRKDSSRGRPKPAPAPKNRGYDRYEGLANVRARRDEDKHLPVGSHGTNPVEFKKYTVNNAHAMQLDSDLAWTDARRAAQILLKAVPPLTKDLDEQQKLGYEHLITDLLFHVPKFGHELMAGKGGKFGGLDLEDRTYFKSSYATQIAISGNAAKITLGDLLRCLQLAKTDFNSWSFEMKDTMVAVRLTC